MNSSTSASSDGPSKNELKKLAKKAEKAAKKAAKKGGSVPPPPPPSSATSGGTTNNDTKPPPCSSWTITKPGVNERSTIVCVWATQAFGKEPLKVAKKTNNDNNKTISSSTTTLVANDTATIAGGGNAMALAIAGATSTTNYLDTIFVDEWCEWERTQLRPSGKNNNKATTTTSTMQATALSYLDNRLSNGKSPVHLVGSQLSVADICVATTLFLNNASNEPNDGPPIHRHVQLFLNAHRPAFDAARAAAQQLASSATIDYSQYAHHTSLLQTVDEVFRSTIATVFGDNLELPRHVVKICGNAKHGDYQLSAAMPIFATLKKRGGKNSDYANPPAIAQAIVECIGNDHAIVQDLTIQGPGFILCKVRETYLQFHLNAFLTNPTKTLPMPQQPSQVCVVDFSSPNIAKEMHVGHLRSTIIGEAVCRILEAAGHTVHRVNHVGDWGTQFGMLIEYMRESFDSIDQKNELPNITDLTVFYKNAKMRFDDSPEFKKNSQLNVVKLQSGDPDCRKIWKLLCDISRKEFEKVYQRLDITCKEFGESFYNDKIPPVIEELVQLDKIKIEEGGAKCVFLDGYEIPLMLQKSDGGFGYDSTDMAALKYRLHTLKADRIIVITDFSQASHFAMVYAAGREVGWVTDQKLQHIGFGTVQGEDGKRFKTRSGETVRLVDLLDEAVTRMQGELEQRVTEGKASIAKEDVHQVAEAIGYGAVKYFDLRRNPTSNYKFSYDAMLDTKGDTAVYLLYARVRLESIIRKAAEEHGLNIQQLLQDKKTIAIEHASERNLALQLLRFSDYMEQALDELYPYYICEYVYKLATAASDFVTQCRVLGSDEMESRILLCYCVSMAMKQSLNLLGIRNVDRI